jgi:Fe-S-cluster containining protein
MDWSKDQAWKNRSRDKKKLFRKYLENVNESSLIKQLPALHEEAFSKINCLDCANCCKNHSPTFKTTDVKRISRFMKMRESDFIETYLKLDTDNDLVVKNSPCPFLNTDNTCRIYEVRPSDCARFPYTSEDVFVKRKQLTLANSVVCPAVSYILEKLSQ